MPKPRLILSLLAVALLGSTAQAATDAALEAAIKGPQRTAPFIQRDSARHPLQELEFFGLRPDATVVEIWPPGGYWTEILAPYLHDHGTYYLAIPAIGEGAGSPKFVAKLDADKAVYGTAKLTSFDKEHFDIAPPGTADFVLTFRNLHNWMKDGYADQAMAAFFTALKPGGILGIEDHRARPTKPQDPTADNGYVRQDYTIELAKKAGFEFVGASEIDANPKDTTDWPKGVWTLPPVFALGDQDREKYAAIGEADNFVLKFRKPGK